MINILIHNHYAQNNKKISITPIIRYPENKREKSRLTDFNTRRSSVKGREENKNEGETDNFNADYCPYHHADLNVFSCMMGCFLENCRDYPQLKVGNITPPELS